MCYQTIEAKARVAVLGVVPGAAALGETQPGEALFAVCARRAHRARRARHTLCCRRSDGPSTSDRARAAKGGVGAEKGNADTQEGAAARETFGWPTQRKAQRCGRAQALHSRRLMLFAHSLQQKQKRRKVDSDQLEVLSPQELGQSQSPPPQEQHHS